MRPMLPQITASEAGDHTARSGDIHRPVLLLCRMLTRSARPLAPSHIRSVLSLDVVSTRRDPEAIAMKHINPQALGNEPEIALLQQIWGSRWVHVTSRLVPRQHWSQA